MSREARFDYSGARVLVTGGSNGIGLAIAEAYVKSGAKVAITGTAKEAGDYSHDLSTFEYHSLDTRDGESIDRIVGQAGQLDVLVNCAGAVLGGQEQTADVFEEVLRINLFGTHRACLAAFPGLAGRKGSVINIASMSSFFGFPRAPGYGASKTAIVSLTKSLAALWASKGIRVNAIAPGWVETNMTARARANADRNSAILDRTPLGRWAMPHEMAGAVLFLSSDMAGFITGATLPVDGGYSSV